MTDMINYHDKQNYPGHTGAIAGIIIVFGAFIALGVYSLSYLMNLYGAAIIAALQALAIPTFFLDNILYIVGFFLAIIIMTYVVAMGASYLANRL
ncbi:MAG: hypothetical protein P1Q69_17730 [Candidatus Thorarchaeota archaeon]|nr:hypothetical protein [Candidatus Thorarchaeota archaeon]